MSAIHNWDSAIRHGLRTAASPPGSGTGNRWPARTKRWLSVPSVRISPPDRLIASITGAVEGDSDDGFADASVLGQQRHHVGVVVLDQIQRSIVRVALRPASGVVPRMQVGGQSQRLSAYFAELAHSHSKARSVSQVAMSPMCPDIYAREPSVRQKVFLSSPPTASTAGPSRPMSTGSGA